MGLVCIARKADASLNRWTLAGPDTKWYGYKTDLRRWAFGFFVIIRVKFQMLHSLALKQTRLFNNTKTLKIYFIFVCFFCVLLLQNLNDESKLCHFIIRF